MAKSIKKINNTQVVLRQHKIRQKKDQKIASNEDEVVAAVFGEVANKTDEEQQTPRKKKNIFATEKNTEKETPAPKREAQTKEATEEPKQKPRTKEQQPVAEVKEKPARKAKVAEIKKPEAEEEKPKKTVAKSEQKDKKDEPAQIERIAISSEDDEFEPIIVPEDIAPFISFKDTSNFNFARYYLTEDVESILADIMRMQSVGSIMRSKKLKYLNGLMMYGVPGTGKTHGAEYIAFAMEYPFVFLNFANLLDGGVFGNTAKNINKIFRFMQDKKCVFMLDEIDCIAIKRGTEGAATGGELSRITITLMQELDNYADNGCDCILLAATNRIDIMDAALLSRFPIKHQMSPLNNKDKEGYIIKFLTDVGVQYSLENIRRYVYDNPTVRQRNIESDMTRCIIKWIEEGEELFVLDHVDS